LKLQIVSSEGVVTEYLTVNV